MMSLLFFLLSVSLVGIWHGYMKATLITLGLLLLFAVACFFYHSTAALAIQL